MRIFCMTVGAGWDEREMENLANALSHSIAHYNPDRIIFFGSKNSEKVIERIKQSCKSQNKPILDNEFMEFSNIDNFTECYNEICDVIARHPSDEIIMDYTSGTKTMVSAQCIAALLHGKKLSLTSGKRDITGKVIPKTTKVVEQPLYEAYDKISFENMKRDFNTYRFDSALDSMEKIVICKSKSGLMNIINGYKKWDLMEWNEASELLKDVNLNNTILEKIQANKKFLGTLVNLYNKIGTEKDKDRTSLRTPKEPYVMILADLLNNAHRRITEGKYDDAVSRLYRATELISQIMLLDKGINEINDKIYFSDIEKQIKNRSELEKYKGRIEKEDTGALRKDMGAWAKFQLLKEIGDERGWNNYSRLRSDMQNRNLSIMAHGLKPVGKEAADRFYKSVYEFSYEIFGKKKIDELIMNSKFPAL